MLSAYADAIEQHVNECVEDLEDIHQLLQQRAWTRIERKGAERLLQILVESCIGLSKHWLKQQGRVLPSDAYSVFEKLIEMQLISADDSQQWQRVIGMRNAIVHDYLNLDEQVIKSIINTKMYLELKAFVFKVSKQLKT